MGEMVELPGLMNAIRSVIDSQVAAICVLPNEIVMPLAPDVDVTKLFFPEPDGVVRLKIIEAKDLENKDITFIRKGKSDPYAEIQVGSQFLKTRTIDNDLNPVWNEYFEAVVDQADGQVLRIELFDEDQGQDEELGRLSLDLNMVRGKGQIDRWFPLEGCKHGDLHLKATWMDLSKDLRHLDMRSSSEWLQADKPIHPALLMVYVDSVSELPYPKSKLEPSPFIEVTLGRDQQRTPVKVKTVNPLYQSKFLFFVRHPEGQELKFEAIDDGTRRSLGTMSLPLNQLMKEPELEFYQQTFMLTLGVQQSPMVVTVRLRTLHQRKPSNYELDEDTLRDYANAKHIERASKDQNGKANGANATAVEPSKTVNPKAGMDELEMKLNVNEVQMLRSDSNNSMNSGSISGRSSRIGRVFKSKHEKDMRSRADLPRGEIEMAIRYADATKRLVVIVLKARDLLPYDKKGTCNPYVTIKLLDIKTSKEVAKKKTPTVKLSLNPVFDNHFEFDINSSDLLNHKLLVSIKDDTNYGTFAAKPVIGVVSIRLDSLHERQLPQQWVPLQVERK